MTEPTVDDIEALVGPATPHFAFQLRARVRELIDGLPEDDPVRRFGEEKIRMLDDLGHASSKAEDDVPEDQAVATVRRSDANAIAPGAIGSQKAKKR